MTNYHEILRHHSPGRNKTVIAKNFTTGDVTFHFYVLDRFQDGSAYTSYIPDRYGDGDPL